MTANPPTSPQTAEATSPGVSVSVQGIIDRYSAELAQATSRAIMAEAGLSAAEAEIATLRSQIATPTPTVQEG